MTSPVGMFGAVVAKFLSALILIVIPLISTLMYFAIISYYKMPDVPTYLTSALGFLLLSMTYISFGILASSIAESPIISGILTFTMVLVTTWIPVWFTSLKELSLLDMFIDYLYGKIDIANTVLFITLTILCLSITMIIMQRRKSIK
jgi:ABC-2 type transport system permease protein